MNLFRKSKQKAGENEPFITLIRVAQEDSEIRSQLLKIVSLDKFNRLSALNTLLEEMRFKGAPKEIVSAISCLLDTNVADKAMKLLKGNLKNGD